MRATEHTTSMRAAGTEPERVLLRAVRGDGRESGVDATTGSTAFGPSGIWESAFDGAVARPGAGGQSQAGGPLVGVDGDRSDLPQGLEQPTWGRPPDLPVFVEGTGDQRTGPGVVQRHHVYPGTAGIFVFGGGDGLVESLRAGLGVEQQSGQCVLHSGLGESAGRRQPGSVDLQHRPGGAIHQRAVFRGGGIGRGGGEHGWTGPLDGQPVYRTIVAEPEVRGHLLAGLLGRAGYWTGIGQMVPAVQHATASPSTGQRHAGAVVSGRGRLWGQASGLVVEALLSREAAPSRCATELKPNHRPGLTKSLVCAKKQMDKKTNQKGASNDLCVPGSFRFKWIRKSCRSATGKTEQTTSRADSESTILISTLCGLNKGVHFNYDAHHAPGHSGPSSRRAVGGAVSSRAGSLAVP